MLSVSSQKLVEDKVTLLEVIDHPADLLFNIAKDFASLDKKTLDLYFEVYCGNYSSETLYDLQDVVSEIISIRNIFTEDLTSLGFEIDESYFYEGLELFAIFLRETASYLGMLQHSFDPEEDKERSLKTIWEGVERQKIETSITRDVFRLQSKVGEYIATGLEGIDHDSVLEEMIYELNALVEKYGLYIDDYDGDRKRKLNISLPKDSKYFPMFHSFDEEVYYRYEDEGNRLRIKKQMSFILSFITFLHKGKRFYQDLDVDVDMDLELTQIYADRLKYGAKGAYLRFLKRFRGIQQEEIDKIKDSIADTKLDEIEKILQDYRAGAVRAMVALSDIDDNSRLSRLDEEKEPIQIPPSIEISVELYLKWMEGKDIDSDLEEIYQQSTEMLSDFNGNAETLIVRSSAVYSEDNEGSTGAGVYESIPNVESFENFKEAVLQVFASVNTPLAESYRRGLGIEEELMGLIIQPFIRSSRRHAGYINTSNASRDYLMDITDNAGARITINKEVFPIDHTGTSFIHVYHSLYYNIDFEQFSEIEDSLDRLAYFGFLFERLFGKPMQLEYIIDERDEEEQYFVQLRPLPRIESNDEEIIFPDETPIYEGRSVIPGDVTVSSDEVFYKQSSHEATRNINSIISAIEGGEKKVFVIGNSYGTERGHIETLCAENGMLCVTNDPFNDQEFFIPEGSKVRIVSDGEIARIYVA